MRKFERFDAVAAAHLANESADPAEPRVSLGERPDELAGNERLGQKADVVQLSHR
jgi:hypothetical protein